MRKVGADDGIGPASAGFVGSWRSSRGCGWRLPAAEFGLAGYGVRPGGKAACELAAERARIQAPTPANRRLLLRPQNAASIGTRRNATAKLRHSRSPLGSGGENPALIPKRSIGPPKSIGHSGQSIGARTAAKKQSADPTRSTINAHASTSGRGRNIAAPITAEMASQPASRQPKLSPKMTTESFDVGAILRSLRPNSQLYGRTSECLSSNALITFPPPAN